MEIKVMHQVMEWNEDVSDAVKAELAEHQVCLINVMGSPGAGKTSMIVSLINRLRETYRIGVSSRATSPAKWMRIPSTPWAFRWCSWTPMEPAISRP